MAQHDKSATVVSVLRDYSMTHVEPVSTIDTRPTHPTGGGTTAANPDSHDDSGTADVPELISTLWIIEAEWPYDPGAVPVGAPRAAVVDVSEAPAL